MQNLWYLALFPLAMGLSAWPACYIIALWENKEKKRKALRIYGLLIALDSLVIYPLALFYIATLAIISIWLGSLVGLIIGATLLELLQDLD